MRSPWQLPLPDEEYATRPVVVYFYSDRWIPMTCFCLNEAISLYRKGLLQGKKISVFPAGLDLETENILLTEASCLPDKLASQFAYGDTCPRRQLAQASA